MTTYSDTLTAPIQSTPDLLAALVKLTEVHELFAGWDQEADDAARVALRVAIDRLRTLIYLHQEYSGG